MKQYFTLTSFLTIIAYAAGFVSPCAAQCPYAAELVSNSGYCTGAVLQVSTSHSLSAVTWYKDGVVVATDSAALTFNQTGIIVAGRSGGGTGADQLSAPWAIFVDDDGNMYIADQGNNRVMKWAAGATSGVVVAGGNGYGDGPDQLAWPTGVYADKQGNLYVLDGGNARVQKWAPGAASGVTVAGGNGMGPADNQLNYPYGMAVDCSGNIYVADQGNRRVVKWAPGASSGITVAGGNRVGTAGNQLFDAYDVGVDSLGNVYVTEPEFDEVVKWAPGATSGVIIASGTGARIVGQGLDTANVGGPTGIYADAGGTLYIVDNRGLRYYDGRILQWPPGATGGRPVAGYGAGAGSAPLPNAAGVFLDRHGNLYVTDILDGYVQEFAQQSTIGNTYTAKETGHYWAVATDMNGYAATTNTIFIHPPPAVPPSVSITATATNVYICQPVTFTAVAAGAGAGARYQWQVSGVNAGADTSVYTNNIFANGDKVYCILTSDSSCTGSDTSNIIALSVDPQVYTTVTIADSPSIVCQGVAEAFAATVINGSNAPVFEWLVNGVPTSESGNVYRSDTLTSGDVVYCLITSDASCGLAKSNSIPVTVYPMPTVTAGQVFNIPYGKSLQLEPVITGNIESYLWSPGAGLSDSTIMNPVADPSYSTTYELQVTAAGGCTAKGIITVDVYTPLVLPNAFSPNGDGRNDIFYVLGGPQGSVIKHFLIFNRWGAEVFGVRDGVPGDPAFGWDGRYGGAAAPAGTYLYEVMMSLPGGRVQQYKGTVVLVR